MRKTYELDRNYLFLLPVLALGLTACPSDENVSESATEGATGTESATEDDSESADPSGDPGPSTPTDADDTTNPTGETTTPTTGTPTTENPETTVGPDTSTTDGDTEVGTDTGTDTDSSTGEPVEELVGVWGSVNPAGVTGDAIVGLTPGLDALAPTLTIQTDVLSVQSVAINTGNDAAITFDAPGGVGGVIIDENLAQNPMSAAIGLGDRVITGPATGLTAPKGAEWLGNMGLFVVADTGAMAMKVFDINDEGDVAPMFEITNFGTSTAIWDMHYVTNTDVLYAAGTNGEVQVYEDFLMTMGAAGPDRTIVPSEAGAKISVNLHGITILNGTLYLTDVGDPMNMADGQLFLIKNAADADGDVDVDEKVTGGMLGNPVDLEVRAGVPSERVFVAEKSNKALLIFSRALAINPLAQSAMLAIDAPESIATIGNGNALIVARNGATLDGDAALAVNAPGVGNPTVTATLDRLGSVTSIQSVALNHGGDAWVGFDGAAVSGGGGVFQIPGLALTSDDGVVSAIDTRLWGPSTGIVAPKGLTLSADSSALIVADFGDGDIKVFDAAATGDTAPVFIAAVPGEVPWDTAYDDAQDRLFVAGTNGSVAVFDGFLADQGQSAPTRFFTPSYEGGESVNLHGIAYDAATDTLFVSDVGDAMVADDGFVYVIADASTAEDVTVVKAAIGGDLTGLGNPVDVAFDGANLYIAEKANSRTIRYDGVLDLEGLVNEAPAASADVTNNESVQLFFAVP